MILNVASLAIFLAIISNYPFNTYAAIVSYPKELAEEPQVYFIPQLRERRSPQYSLSGGGSNRQGTIRLDGQKNVFDNGRTRLDASGFAQRSWSEGYPSQNSFGAGGRVTHNLYKGRNGHSLDVYGGYQRQWNTPSKDNINTGLIYRF